MGSGAPGNVHFLVKAVFEEQLGEELGNLSEISQLIGLSVPAEELLEYSGLTVSRFSVKGHNYLKLIGVLTGERAGKVEEWFVRKKGEEEERERRMRKKNVHLLNLKDTEENRRNLGWLVHYWRRAKAIKKWLEEVESLSGK